MSVVCSRCSGLLVGLAGVLIALTGCLQRYSRVNELVNPNIPGSKFRELVVIAEDDDDTSLQIALRVRMRLQQEGWTVIRRGGRWTTEFEALDQLCPRADSTAQDAGAVDGVLIVGWDRFTLWDCAERRAAYEIRGGYTGIDNMFTHLRRYLKGGVEKGEMAVGSRALGDRNR